MAEDGDWRVRARNIAAGSLGAGRVGKALAAQQISMARVEDLWPLTLSREEAAERQSRVRSARQRDERRAKRDSEREQRSDRVSRADLEKAQDGRVGAQIRIVIGGQPRDRKRKGEDAPKEEPKRGLRRPRPPRVLNGRHRPSSARRPALPRGAYSLIERPTASLRLVSGPGARGARKVAVEKVITIPPEPAEPDQLPDALKPFSAVPPLVTDIALSIDDQELFVSCWGTGELKRYDVSNPASPKETGSVRIGGIVERSPHPASGPVNGGPQMVEVSRDGKRVYLTNSLYASWDAQFYPEGIDGWMVKLDNNGSLELDPRFFVEFDGERPHQIRLEGGDASSDSYCFPS